MEERICFATDDGKTISAHFGMAGNYLVVDIKDGIAISSELRQKPFHEPAKGGDGAPHSHHGHDHSLRDGMIEAVRDCRVVIAGGMGKPMHDALTASGATVYVTRIRQIEEALEVYGKGLLDDQPGRVH